MISTILIQKGHSITVSSLVNFFIVMQLLLAFIIDLIDRSNINL